MKNKKPQQSPILESIKNFKNIPSEIVELNRKFTALNALEKTLILVGIVGTLAFATVESGKAAKRDYAESVAFCKKAFLDEKGRVRSHHVVDMYSDCLNSAEREYYGSW